MPLMRLMTQDGSLLDSLDLAGEGLQPVRLPPLFLEIDRWLSAEADGRIDVAVMPKVGRAACWFALCNCLSSAYRGFQKRLNEHSIDRFKIGDLVAVLPSREVYEFKGIYREHEGLIKLGIIKDPHNGTISIPASQLSRLQHSQKSTPRGTGATSRRSLDLTPLDHVIGTTSFGNADFFDTEVIYLGNRARFQNAMSVLRVGRNLRGVYYQFATDEVLPWGRITTGGEVRTEGDDTGMARPLIARANSAVNIIDFLESGNTDCKCIVVDDVHVFRRELNSLCRLMEDFDCRVVGFCGFRDFRELQQLERTGLIRPRQIRPDLLSQAEGDGIFRSIACSAKRAVDFEWIDVFEIENHEIKICADALGIAETSLRSGEIDLDEAGILGRGYGLLRRLANPRLDGARDEGALEAIEKLKEDFTREVKFWPKEANIGFRECLQGFLTLQASPENIAALKKDSIEGLIDRRLTEEELSLEDVGFFELGDEALVLSGWPRRAKVQERVFEYDHDHVYAVAFSFEERWFRQFNKSYRDAELYAAEKDSPYRPTHGSLGAQSHWRERSGESSFFPDVSRERFRNLLKDRRDASDANYFIPANLIWFADGRVCAVSEQHKIPTLRSFGMYRGESNIDVRMVLGTDLEKGDLCAFRADSEEDLVRIFARSVMPKGEYDKLWDVAGRWRAALREWVEVRDARLPELCDKLLMHGLKRTPAAIRNWLYGPSIIGPSSKADLKVVANAIGNATLSQNIDPVWSAIKSIRSKHLSAGSGISGMLRSELVQKMEHCETLTGHFLLSLGEVDVVEVDAYDTPGIEIRSNLVNRLLKPERLNV